VPTNDAPIPAADPADLIEQQTEVVSDDGQDEYPHLAGATDDAEVRLNIDPAQRR